MVYLPYPKEIIKHFRNPKNLGRIKNPDAIGEAGNLLCVLPETKIWSNNRLIPINQIKKKAFVLSHDGMYNTVTSVHSRVYKGEIIVLKSRLGKTNVTPSHLVFAMKIPKTSHYLRTKNKKKLQPFWYHAREVERGDILLYPILREEKDVEKIPIKIKKFKYDFRSKSLPPFIEVNEKFLRLVGYFLAEGFASTKITSSYVQFSLNIKEKDISANIKSIVKDLFDLNVNTYHVEDRNTMVVFIYNSILARFFKKMFGKNAKDKHIPHFMMLLPKEKQRHLIYGLWRGDGYINLKGKNPRAGFSTISYQLAQQLKLLLLGQGIISSLYIEREVTRKGVHHQTAYRLHIGDKNSLTNLCKILNINWSSSKRSQLKSWIENGFLYTPVTEVRVIKYRGLVNNLEVNSTRSFVTDSAILHNCGDVMRIYLKIKKNGQEKISDIKGEVFGCIVAIANTSMLTTTVKGKTLKEAIKIEKEELIEKLGGEKIPPIKIHCSILALDALHEAIYNYYKKKKLPIPQKLIERHKAIQKTLKVIEERHKEYIELERKLLK